MQNAWWAYWEARALQEPGQNGICRFIPSLQVSNWAKTIHGWIELVVKCNNAISICENPVYRRHVRLDPINRKTLRRYIIKLADIVGLLIKETIGPGNCIAEAWSCAGVHYFAIKH